MQKVAYGFKYSLADDSITFSLEFGGSAIKLSLKANDFFELCDNLAISGRTFLDGVKERQTRETGHDAEFNINNWDKLMDSEEVT